MVISLLHDFTLLSLRRRFADTGSALGRKRDHRRFGGWNEHLLSGLFGFFEEVNRECDFFLADFRR